MIHAGGDQTQSKSEGLFPIPQESSAYFKALTVLSGFPGQCSWTCSAQIVTLETDWVRLFVCLLQGWGKKMVSKY